MTDRREKDEINLRNLKSSLLKQDKQILIKIEELHVRLYFLKDKHADLTEKLAALERVKAFVVNGFNITESSIERPTEGNAMELVRRKTTGKGNHSILEPVSWHRIVSG